MPFSIYRVAEFFCFSMIVASIGVQIVSIV